MPSLSGRDPDPYFTLNYSIYNFEAKTIYELAGGPVLLFDEMYFPSQRAVSTVLNISQFLYQATFTLD